MKKLIGFDINEKTEKIEIETQTSPVKEEIVRSVVTVRFNDGREFPYYNDAFNLKVDDIVFVDGKLEGKPGRVVAVTTKFKVSLEFYKKVISRINLEFHGKFRQANNLMLCDNTNALTAQQVLSWYFPPKDEEFAVGEGYTVPLSDITKCDDFYMPYFNKAIDLYEDGAVKFIRVSNGKGVAVVEGSIYHLVEFEYENGVVANLLCDCIKPSLCSHALAACISLDQLIKNNFVDADNPNFTALGFNEFYKAVTYNCKEITV